LDEERQTVQQLRSYIGTSLPCNHSSTDVLEEEKATLRVQQQKSELELSSLRSTVELLNVRLASLTKIVNIQESELSKGSYVGTGPNGRIQTLLTKWREKVFALLVQQKSQEIEDSKRRAQAEREHSMLAKQVKELQAECEIQRHSLADRTAQLEIQSHKTQVFIPISS
jgi:coiled-coil alpha-helical rod protein 1